MASEQNNLIIFDSILVQHLQNTGMVGRMRLWGHTDAVAFLRSETVVVEQRWTHRNLGEEEPLGAYCHGELCPHQTEIYNSHCSATWMEDDRPCMSRL